MSTDERLEELLFMSLDVRRPRRGADLEAVREALDARLTAASEAGVPSDSSG